MRVIAVTFAVGIVLAACSVSSAEDPLVAVTCAPRLSDRVTASDDLFDGLVALPHFEAVAFSGWDMDPYGHPSWRHGLHSLDHVWPAIAAHMEGRTGHLEAALEVARDWLSASPVTDFAWAAHTTAKRTQLLTCLYLLRPEPWLASGLETHVAALSDSELYADDHNHGISQDIALLQASCALTWPDSAAMAESRLVQLVGAKIDDQGMVDEQAAAYQGYILSLLGWYEQTAAACSRTSVLPDLLPAATAAARLRLPDGSFVPIGDTYIDEEYPWDTTRPTAASSFLEVYEAGYVLGRADDAFFSLRYGPGRRIHGHDDHTSIYLYAAGGPRLVEGGYTSDLALRPYMRGPTAHNQVVVDGLDYQRGATELVEFDLSARVFAVADQPYPGVLRERTVDVSLEPVHVRVEDRLASAEEVTFRQLWHLPPGSRAAVAGAHVTILFPDGLMMSIAQLGDLDSITIIEGQEDPLLGWSAVRATSMPAPVVVSTVTGESAHFVTEISSIP